MAIVLGIDTATTGCAAAISRDGKCLAEVRERMTRGQSEALMPMVDGVMREAGVAFACLDAIAVTRGPGAFTGLRIGLAAARALALTIAKPCLGIITFDILFQQVQETGGFSGIDALVIAVDSKREELFIALYNQDGGAIGTPQALRPDAAAPMLSGCRRIGVAGDAGAKMAAVLGADFEVVLLDGVELPDPRVIADIGSKALNNIENYPATPLYLRPPDVTLPKPGA